MAIFWGHFHTHFATFTSNKTNILQHSDTKIFKNIDQSVTIQQPKAFFTVLFIIKDIKCFAPKNENRPMLEKCSYEQKSKGALMKEANFEHLQLIYYNSNVHSTCFFHLLITSRDTYDKIVLVIVK